MNNKIVIAMDSFKGSASSNDLGEWIKEGIHLVDPDAEVSIFSIADGGEGTLEALVEERNGKFISKNVNGPIGKKVEAKFGVIDEDIAIIEMAEASGISLTSQTEEEALEATTYGVGELVIAALDEGVKTILIGIGGSATTDGGAGFAQAIGVKLLDSDGNDIKGGAESLSNIETIDISGIDKRLEDVTIKILSDVKNPLIGENGAAYIYGPQKGIPKSRLAEVDKWLNVYGEKIEKEVNKDLINKAGSGAAGGLGFGLLAFTKAEMASGIEEILSMIKIEDAIKESDLVITGEGRMDNQSIFGKAPIGVASIAKQYDKPVIAIVASRENDLSNVFEHGVDLVLSIINEPMDLQESIKNVKENTRIAGETAIRAYLINQKEKGE